MTADAAARPIRLTTPAELVDAVPHLVGFQPEDSLVIISLRGKRRRLGVVARLDLIEIWSGPHRAKMALDFLRRDGASSVFLVFYPPSEGRAHASIEPTVSALKGALEPAGIKVLDAVCVFEDRWFALLCGDAACCPPEGTLIEAGAPSAVAIASIASGRVTLGSRKELERTIEPVGGLAGAAMRQALPQAQAALEARIERFGFAVVVEETISALAEAVEARLAEDHPRAVELEVDHAARLIVGLGEIPVRDEILRWVGDDWGDATRSLLLELAPRALAPFDVEPLTALAWVSYLQGEGALAGIVIDHLRATGVATRLLLMLDQVLSAGVSPTRFRDAIRNPTPPRRARDPRR